MLQYLANLLLRDAGKPLDEFRELSSVFEIFKQCAYRHASATKYPCTTDSLGIALNRRTGRPLNHSLMIRLQIRKLNWLREPRRRIGRKQGEQGVSKGSAVNKGPEKTNKGPPLIVASVIGFKQPLLLRVGMLFMPTVPKGNESSNFKADFSGILLMFVFGKVGSLVGTK